MTKQEFIDEIKSMNECDLAEQVKELKTDLFRLIRTVLNMRQNYEKDLKETIEHLDSHIAAMHILQEHLKNCHNHELLDELNIIPNIIKDINNKMDTHD